MTKEQERIINQYKELKNFSKSHNIDLNDRENTKYLKTLEHLIRCEYIQSLDIGEGNMYIKCDAFDDFEKNYREEIGEPLPKLFDLVSNSPDFNSIFHYGEDFLESSKIVHDVQTFIDWKNDVKYELEKLKKSSTVTTCIQSFNSMDGFNDEDMFHEIVSSLRVVVENYNDFIISKKSYKPCDLEGKNNMYEKIFISHKSSDKKYGDAIAALLRNLGLRNDQIIYTSHPLHKIPNNQNIYNYLKNNISQKIFCLFIFSNEYFESAVCLNEMGAFWVTQSEYQNSFVPNFDFNNYSFKNCVIDTNNMGFNYVNESMSNASLIEFKNDIVTKFGLPKVDDTTWEYVLSKYKDAISTICNSNENLIADSRNSKSEIDPDVIALLTAANKSTTHSGIIMRVQDLGGVTIQAGETSVNTKTDNKDTAKWEYVLKSTLENGFIEQTDTAGKIFKITHLGYNLID